MAKKEIIIDEADKKILDHIVTKMTPIEMSKIWALISYCQFAREYDHWFMLKYMSWMYGAVKKIPVATKMRIDHFSIITKKHLWNSSDA